jgi:hypothetical protein
MKKLIVTAVIISLFAGLALGQPPTPESLEEDTSSQDSIPVPEDSLTHNLSEDDSMNDSNTESSTGDGESFLSEIINFFSSIF